MDTEVWKPVRGRRENVEVSNFGRVRDGKTGVERVQALSKGYKRVRVAISSPRRFRLKEIPWGQRQGADEGSDFRYSAFVHRLVVEAFLRGLGEGDEVNHKDGDKRNNRLENLEIVDRRGNAAHASKTGLVCRGERHANAVLSDEKVREIRASKESASALAWKFGCSVKAICRARDGETWAHVR